MKQRKRKCNCRKLRKQKTSFETRVANKNYEISFEEIDQPRTDKTLYGLCDHPGEKEPQMIIHTEQHEEEMMDTLIHEYLHAMLWDKHETYIKNRAKELKDLLWKSGFRLN